MHLTAEQNRCSRCGAAIPPDAPLNQCPHCLLELTESATVSPGKALPERFGHYELIRQLGRGAMGVVYEATDTKLRRRVALKVILDSQAASPMVRRRFTIEAEAAAKLDHPGIVPIYEVGEWEGQPFLSMKMVIGESLRDKISAGEIGARVKEGSTGSGLDNQAAEAIARLMAKVARAVQHAHDHGVLHRDLKPANVLIDAQGLPHLTDFGLAKLLDETPVDGELAPATLSGSILGTPSYMSPEQAAGRRLSAAADIYALGAILYELLTGRPPFKAASAIETMRMVAEQEPRRARALQPRIPRDLDTICMKSLEKDPERRYLSAAALADDLDRWLGRRPICARPSGPVVRLTRWTRRNPTGAALIVTLCCALSIALALLQRANTERNKSEQRLAALIFHLTKQIEEFWEDPEQTKAGFSSSDLAAFCNYAARPLDQPGTLQLTLTFELTDDPMGRARAYAPVLRQIENRMATILRRPVLFDLVIYKYKRGAESPAAGGVVDFQRMSPLDYLRAKQAEPRLQLLFRERADKKAVIFARKESGISRLSEVAGHRVAFAHTNSIISALAMLHLTRAGVFGTNLSRCQHMNLVPRRAPARSGPSPAPSTGNDNDFEFFAHREVIEAVLTNGFDVGESRRVHFERFRRRGLVELHSYSVTPEVYVARPGLPGEIADAFRQSFLSLRSPEDKQLLEKLHSTPVQGFDPVSDKDFEQLRQELMEAIALFEPNPP